MIGRAAVVLAAVTVLAPLASAEPIELVGDQSWNVQTRPGDRDATFEFLVGFQVDAPRDGYLKVLPTTWNPAYANGTPEADGWWTEVAFTAPDARTLGATNGTTNIELGALQPSTNYTFRLTVHAPGDALGEPIQYRLTYALAVREPQGTTGSGGSLDPSLSILPVVEVTPDAPAAAASDEPFVLPSWLPTAGMVGAALLVVGLIAFGAYRLGQRGRTGGGPR